MHTRRSRRLRAALLGAILAVAPQLLPAQSGLLEWPRVTVAAHLDSTGALHVRETQTIRFTGDWNGGERYFDLRGGQEVALHSLTRLDSGETGEGRALRAGDLARVDEFDWTDSRTLRWRGRLPEDPPFDRVLRTYTLVYTYQQLLRFENGKGYSFDHDFGIGARMSPIEDYSLTFTMDSVWATDLPMPLRVEHIVVPADSVIVLTVPLRFLGAGRPSGVFHGATSSARLAIASALGVFALVLLIVHFAREAQLGRFRRIPDHRSITPEWLKEHVFSMLPEVAGAAWDENTSAAEVGAVLARLVQEGKLSSEVKTEKLWIFSNEILHLKLEVRRNVLTEHERALIDGLFQKHEDTTDTQRVRERYKKTGFNPANLIKPHLERALEAATGAGTKTSARRTAILAVTAIACMIIGAMQRVEEIPMSLLAVFVSLFALVVATGLATAYRHAASIGVITALLVVVPVSVFAVAFAAFALYLPLQAGFFTWLGIALWGAMLTQSVANSAYTRHAPERIALRQRLMAARRFFVEQLRSPAPQLQDAWYPYLIAFGLGRSVDKWFRAFAGTAAARSTSALGRTASSGGSMSSGSGGWSGFGGGGGFSGAGASASFASAVGGMAAAVSAPSSSSGGSRGGGGSSGGGRSGGW
ncbi:MAG: DUF2207 domain-containing protein [Gemmatimonadaceae bacterium]|nr:DUF2207 domain-containing protein [Gemmatimonadaceae bacterium]